MKSTNRRDNWRALTEQGVALLKQGQAQQALKSLTRARRLAPQERDVRYWLANACRMTGQIDRAEKLFRKLLAERPNDYEVSFALAFLLRDAGRPGEAADTLLEAAEQPGVDFDQMLQLADFLRDCNQFRAAIEVREKASALRPDRADCHYQLGRLYQATGQFDRALDAFHKTLEFAPSIGPAWISLVQQKTFADSDDEDFRRLEAVAGRSYGNEADMCIAFAHGKALDDLGRWQEAWGQYGRGNALAADALPWSRQDWQQFVDGVLSKPPGRQSESPSAGRGAVFVVGMLRSGTTLLERLLDRHPLIAGRGELNFLDELAKQVPVSARIDNSQRREMADLLWTQMRLDGPENGYYIDKNPLNFRYLDRLFELLPAARVVHVERDGRDSCLSCYFHLFQHHDAAFSNSLENLAAFYSGYRRLMAHWETLYAGRVFKVRYEDLVRDRSSTLAATLEFIGVDWDGAVTDAEEPTGIVRTASVWQARQAIHQRSVGRWRQYESQAAEFFARLAAIDAEQDADRT